MDCILPVKQSNMDIDADRWKVLKQTLNQGVHGTCGAHVSMKWLPDYAQSFDSSLTAVGANISGFLWLTMELENQIYPVK